MYYEARTNGGGHARYEVDKPQRRNDEERRLWVLNDEGLYLWQRRSRQSMRAFIRENRAEIDQAIDRALGR